MFQLCLFTLVHSYRSLPFCSGQHCKGGLIAKYATSGLGPVTIQWWSAFIEMLEADMKTHKESSPTWLLTELLELKKNAQHSSVEDALVPEQLSQMWEIARGMHAA